MLRDLSTRAQRKHSLAVAVAVVSADLSTGVAVGRVFNYLQMPFACVRRDAVRFGTRFRRTKRMNRAYTRCVVFGY